MNTDAVRLGYESAQWSAVAFAGGSWYGLAVSTGVADEIKEETPNTTRWDGIAGVLGAIVYDLAPRRLTAVTPNYELGRAALSAAHTAHFPLGAHGAGRFTMQGGYFGPNEAQHSGQGGAFRQVGPTKIAVFTVVNAYGTVVNREGMVVRCGHGEGAQQCGTIAARLAARVNILGSPSSARVQSVRPGESGKTGSTKNTTITLVVTNQKLPFWALQRLAMQVHTSMARAIQPFHTVNDGDVLYAVTTKEIENPRLDPVDLGLIAGELAWDAILSSVPTLDPPVRRAQIAPDPAALDRYAGDYDFGSGISVTIKRDGERLLAQVKNGELDYVPTKATAAPISPNTFEIESERRDILRFDEDPANGVVGLTVNPGQWPLSARRVK
jgi:L-aminopeptidase/D-esterase-like protein